MNNTSKLRAAFRAQRTAAKQRGIAWGLTFGEWYRIWLASGHLHERGKRSGQYVMSRPGDKGPYVIGNIEIIRVEENSRQANIGHKRSYGQKHSEETRLKLRLKNLGKKMPPQTKEALIKANIGNKYAQGLTHRRGTKHTPKSIEKMRQSHRLQHLRKKFG